MYNFKQNVCVCVCSNGKYHMWTGTHKQLHTQYHTKASSQKGLLMTVKDRKAVRLWWCHGFV